MPESKVTEKQALAKLEAAETRTTELEAQLVRSGKLAELTDAQKIHLNTLDEKGQDEYLGKTAEERQAVLAKSEEEDAVVFTDGEGNEFRKSDDPRLVSMAKQRDTDRKDLAKAHAERRQDGLDKRAESELTDLPGDVKVRAAIIEAIDGIENKDVRKAAHESVQAGSKAIKAAFATLGDRSAVAETDSEKELDRLAKAYAKDKSVDYYTAYAAVANSNPELAKRATDGN